MLLNEGRVSSIKELVKLLKGAGMPRKRESQVVQALTPFAEVVFSSRFSG